MKKRVTWKREVYRRSIRRNGTKIASPEFTRKADADAWYLEKKVEKDRIRGGLATAVRTVTVQEFGKKWLVARKAAGKPMSSWTMDRTRLTNYIWPVFGSRPLHKINTWEWEELLDGLVADDYIGPATRNRLRSLLSKLYNDAWRMDHVLVNPISKIPRFREQTDCWDYWESEDEIGAYLSAAEAEGTGFALFANCSLNFGARMGEIIALKWADVSLPVRSIKISKVYEQESKRVIERTKSYKVRYVGINEPLYDYFEKLCSGIKRSRAQDHLVIDPKGRLMDHYAVRRAHGRTCKRARVKVIRVHDMRHTYASHYVMNGGALKMLQEILGHSSPYMTEKYAHLRPGFLSAKADIVGFRAKPLLAVVANSTEKLSEVS